MSKVMLWGPTPWCRTGYGGNLLNLALRLKQAGHEVVHFALTGLAFGEVEYQGIKVLPNNSGDYGQAWLPRWNQLYGPFDCAIFHYDAWVLGGWRPPDDLRVFWYSPLDHSPVPPPLVHTFKSAGGTVLAMTRFAEEELKKAGIQSIYLPHAIDVKQYCPGDMKEARRKLELPEDCFLLTTVATNKGPRKNLGNLLRAFQDFLDQVPRARENAFLMLHTNVTRMDNPSGLDLQEIWKGLGIEERIKYTHPLYYEGVGFTEDEIAALYRASDWTLLPSMAEGFALPAAESLACGTPVIYSDCSALPEVVGGGGLAVEIADRMPFELSSSFQWIPSTDSITQRMVEAYEDWEAGGKLRDRLAATGREHVLSEYSWERVMPLWLKVIEGDKAQPIELKAKSERDGEIDIMVITHNRFDLFSKCVESLYRETTLPFHLVVVDDQSMDETLAYMKGLWQEKGNITYIRPAKKARGGAQIMDIGLKHCRNDLIVSMNNDIIVTPGWLEEAVRCMESDPHIGIVGMKFLYPDNKIQHAGGVFIKNGLPFHLGMGEPRESHSETREVSWVSGPCVLVRRQCLGPGWDESYDSFGGHEDVDLCLRARKEGWKVMYCGKAEVYHLEGATVLSMPNFMQMHTRARQIFLNRWGGTGLVQ